MKRQSSEEEMARAIARLGAADFDEEERGAGKKARGKGKRRAGSASAKERRRWKEEEEEEEDVGSNSNDDEGDDDNEGEEEAVNDSDDDAAQAIMQLAHGDEDSGEDGEDAEDEGEDDDDDLVEDDDSDEDGDEDSGDEPPKKKSKKAKMDEGELARQALRENVEAGNRALSCGEIAEWEDHSKQFHKIFYAYAQSPCLDEADAKLRPRLELLSCIYYQSASREKINKEHNEILRLVLDDNFEAAQKLMRAHLECDMLYAIKGYHAYNENL